MGLSTTALLIAIGQLGVHEQGANNSGPEVDQFLASVGLDPGYSWCCAFIFWIFRQAAQQLNLVNPCPRTASVLKLWKLSETVWRDSNPSPGAIYILDHGGGLGHAGIVETAADGNVVSEVSGNTNQSGSRNGDSVWRHLGAPEISHGGVLLGYILLDRAAQAPIVNA